NMRLVFWKLALNNLWIENKIWLGVGTGDAQDYIDNLYRLPEYKIDGYVGWNSHNQWVTTCIQQGILGLFVLTLLFAIPFQLALKNRDVKLISFLVVTFLFSLTESIFETNKGIVFFTLFFCLLVVRTDHSGKSKSTKL
ncbi:MAG: O-antigen ligase family protein, partial [Flammeovirgaceae bacterium]